MDDRNLGPLPRGWVWTRVREIADIVQGQSPPSTTYNEEGKGLPFYQGKLDFGNTYPSPTKWCNAPTKVAEKGDVLISVRAPVGPTNICLERSCIGRGLAAIRSADGIETFFILYLMRAFEQILSGQGTGTTFNAVTGNHLRNLAVPLPPLPEQRRIVARIEELFTRLDAGIDALNKVKTQLKRYRQSVLKAAFEGSLTANWREAHKGELETASVLLEKIKAERAKSGKYKETTPLDTAGLPELPEGWVWMRVGEITEINPRLVHELPSGQEISFLPMRCVAEMSGKLDLSIIKAYEEVRKGFTNFQDGDVIFAKITPCMENGKVAIVNKLKNGIGFGSTEFHVIRPRAQMPSSLFFFFLIQEDLRKDAKRHMTGTAGQLRVPATYLSDVLIPLPPLPEQHRIVEEIERHFSVADEIEKTVEQGLKQAERLRQSILKTAFEGNLVPQDPNDEPAEQLLERIKASRAGANGRLPVRHRT